ncbi:MAG: M23 family metallopeptidase [Egibacteraceae bacterium]
MLSPPRRRFAALAWALGLLLIPALILPLPARPAVGQEPAPAEAAEAERLAAEQAEAARLEAQRVEAERVEAERTRALRAAVESAKGELTGAEGNLIAALGRRNRAAGDLVVARLDVAEAQERVVETRDRAERAGRALEEAKAELEDATQALTAEAVRAYRAGSSNQTPAMMAMEAAMRSRSPKEFVDGVGYLRQMLPRRVEQRLQAELDEARAGEAAGQRAHRRAVEELAHAEEALRAAEAEAPRAEARFAAALGAHANRTNGIIGDADRQRAATQAAPPTPSTAENVQLTHDLVALARKAAEVAERMRAGSTRIEAGKEGVTSWRASRCPVNGPTQFVNDWGFPRTGGRSHEGTDVFAERGTAVVAMADGVVTKVSRADVGLGGRSVTYEVDGYDVYNAHLDTVADLEEGDELEAGQAIGTVGTTGNARGTPPHNHLGIYRPEGAPVNPYPLLRRACR